MSDAALGLLGATGCAAAAAAVALSGGRAAAERLALLARPPRGPVPRVPLGAERPPAPAAAGDAISPRLRATAALAASACIALVVNGPPGLVAAGVGGVVLHRWLGRLPSSARARERRRVGDELPLALDLLAACLQAGLPVAPALAAVSRAVDPQLAARLAPAITAFELGAGPVEAWQALADDELLGPVARTLMRAGHTGAASADVVVGLAARHRATRRADYERAARAVGVWAVAPLTVCFLPAFVLVGVVPIIWGLVGGIV